jgi:hypothetical protein
MRVLLAVAFATLFAASAPVKAATTPVEAVQTCLSDSTSGKDRKLLARWIFFAMAAHPELKSLSAASAKAQEDTSRDFAALVTRLMTVDCKAQMRALFAGNGDDASAGMKVAFSHLGQVAMRELMDNKDVEATISQFAQFIDEKQLKSAFQSGSSN